MNRGDRREAIFADDQDRHRFLDTLGEACEKTVQVSVLTIYTFGIDEVSGWKHSRAYPESCASIIQEPSTM
jgi:hypothetical protein